MGDSISFPYYPASNRTPGVFADVDGSRNNTATVNQRTLLMGQMYAAGTATPSMPTLLTSQSQVAGLFGYGSQIYEMYKQYRVSDTFGEVWGAGLTDPSGTKASGTITLTGSTIGVGIIALYIAGVQNYIPVQAGDTLTTIATRAIGVINANLDNPVVATNAAGVITLTAAHTGILGNEIDLRLNYYGALGGEYPVSGLTVTIAPMASGAGVPSLTTLLTNMGAVLFDFVANPFNDTASLNALDTFFNFSTGRWSWTQMLYGGYFTAIRGTVGSLQTFGVARNGPNGSCLGFYDSPNPNWVIAAEYTAQAASSLRVDPNVPLQDIVLNVLSPPKTSAFVRSLQNTLLYSGISTYSVSDAGQMILQRAVTMYQFNTAGVADNSYLDVETLFGTMLLIRSWVTEMTRLFPNAKLFQDGNAIPAGNNATTAQLIGYATVAWYANQCALGNAQNPQQFAAQVLSQNAGSGLVKELLPFILPDQLRQIAGLVRFTK